MTSVRELLELPETPSDRALRTLRDLRKRFLAHVPRPRRIKLRDDLLEDATLLAGLAAIAAGCGWIFPPTAPIVGGLFLVVLALRSATTGGGEDEQPETRTVERWYSDGTEPEDD